jgi:hypothetical protein
MNVVFDIFQGIGIAAAIGVRPFLPTLAVGALAAGNVQIHFKHTDYAFLQSAPFLGGMAAGAIVCALLRRRLEAENPPTVYLLGLAAVALGALEFAGSLCRDHHPVWPGLVGGAICAAIGLAATAPLLGRVRARLDEGAARALPVYAELGAVLFAALSVVAPPVGVIGVAILLWLLIAGRGRGDQKYAGLRILR